jgi:hypothetical protein
MQTKEVIQWFKQRPAQAANIALLFILPGLLIFYAQTKPCIVYACEINFMGMTAPTDCEYMKTPQGEKFMKALNSKTGFTTNLSYISATAPSGAPSGAQHYVCPDCPICKTIPWSCPKCPATNATTCSSTAGTTSTTTTTFWTPPEVNGSSGTRYTTKPTSIDFKWQMCDPYENVSVPLELIIQESNQTYNFTFLNGTMEVRRRADEVGYKIVKGGCITVPTSCCGLFGYVDAIQSKLYRKYYSEVLKNCSYERVVCPGTSISPIGLHPKSACVDGRCVIANRG